jgi:hypothetical protein
MFDKSIEQLRADVLAAQEHLRQARAECDPTLSKEERLFLLQPFAVEVHRAQEALWRRLPREELEAELAARRAALGELPLHDPRKSGAMVAVSDLDRYLHPHPHPHPHAPPPAATATARRRIVAGVAVALFVAAVVAWWIVR